MYHKGYKLYLQLIITLKKSRWLWTLKPLVTGDFCNTPSIRWPTLATNHFLTTSKILCNWYVLLMKPGKSTWKSGKFRLNLHFSTAANLHV